MNCKFFNSYLRSLRIDQQVTKQRWFIDILQYNIAS